MTVHRFNFTVRTAAPTGLSSTATTSSSVSLSWSAVQYATGYRLYRGGVLVASPTGTTATDSGLAASTSYSYTVSAVSAGGESAQSGVLNATTAGASAAGQAIVTWTAPLLNADGSTLSDLAGYRIYYGTSVGSMTQTVTVANPAATSGVVTGLAAGTWYFGVKAYDTSGNESVLSSIVSKVIS
jgi:chitodextrinase